MAARILSDLYALVAGLVVGSYLNVVAYRLPRALSTVRPRSACPFCGGSIRIRDNIPVLSFVLLGGRCRRCGAPISWRYPLLEALTGGLFVAVVERFGVGPPALVAALFASLLVVLAAIDVDCFLLPDRLTLPGILAGLLLQPWIPWTSLLGAALGVLAGAGVLILTINVWYWLRDEEGMGLGDVNMLAMIGAFLGWKGAALALMLAAVSGAAAGGVLLVAGRLGLRSRLPFGLFLALGALAALFLGPGPVDAYLRLP